MSGQIARRIAVTGREGQVARELIATLTRHGHDVIVLARPIVDLTTPQSVRDAIIATHPDLVINAAAYTAVDRAEDEPDLAYAINADGAGAVAAAAAEIGAGIIHFSTDYVFDGHAEVPYDEQSATAPLGVYGASKLAGEQKVMAANARHVIFRTGWVSSPYGNNFVRTMLRLASERPVLRVVDDQRGSPTFATGLADVVAHLVPRISDPSADSANFGVFHVASGGDTTWCQFARAIMDGAQERGAASVPVDAITTADYPTKARRPAFSVLATSKLHHQHGVILPNWEVGLEACLDTLIGRVVK